MGSVRRRGEEHGITKYHTTTRHSQKPWCATLRFFGRCPIAWLEHTRRPSKRR
jgi:hypothetical protein